jgi:hypothetical protein
VCAGAGAAGAVAKSKVQRQHAAPGDCRRWGAPSAARHRPQRAHALARPRLCISYQHSHPGHVARVRGGGHLREGRQPTQRVRVAFPPPTPAERDARRRSAATALHYDANNPPLRSRSAKSDRICRHALGKVARETGA